MANLEKIVEDLSSLTIPKSLKQNTPCSNLAWHSWHLATPAWCFRASAYHHRHPSMKQLLDKA